MSKVNLVFTGTKEVYDYDFINCALYFYRYDPKEIGNVYVGCARGVDKAVRELSRDEWGIEPRVFTADWKKFNKAAGRLRNEEMLEAAKREFSIYGCDVIGLPCEKSRGTIHCLWLAHEMGFRTYSFTHEFYGKYMERWQKER